MAEQGFRATIERAAYLPTWERPRGGRAKWAIIFHMPTGREEFGLYTTKAAARSDAVEFGITLS